MYAVNLICLGSAVAVVWLLMPVLLPKLKKMKFGQTIYDLGPQSHKAKQGTPNMGGLLIGLGTVAASVGAAVYLTRTGREAFPFWSLENPLFALLFVALGSMAIGFTDDYIKDVKKRHDGLSPIQKIIGQLLVGAVFSFYCYYYKGSAIYVPFTDLKWDLGIFYVPVMTLLVMFMTNSANLQDGLDGLLSTVTGVGMIGFGVIGMLLPGGGNLILSACAYALCGGCCGFLRYNAYPARIFMGDTGSMFIGGMMVGLAMLMRMEFLLLLLCFTCILSSLSVMLQVTYFKLTHGKRIFKMSPIHHHFELCGMKETQIVWMYAAVEIVLSALAVWSVSGLF